MNRSTVFIIVIISLSLIVGWLSTTGAKSQLIRLIDVFGYGPLLIYAGIKMPIPVLRYGLIFMGASTMAYNAKNYLEERKKPEAEQD